MTYKYSTRVLILHMNLSFSTKTPCKTYNINLKRRGYPGISFCSFHVYRKHVELIKYAQMSVHTYAISKDSQFARSSHRLESAFYLAVTQRAFLHKHKHKYPVCTVSLQCESIHMQHESANKHGCYDASDTGFSVAK